MSTNTMRKVLIIYNPTAGSASGPELWLGACIHKLCNSGGYIVTTLSTRVETTADNLFESTGTDFDCIVAAGGDGTVRMVLHGVSNCKLDIPVGIIPLGTGNLLARNLRIFEENLLIDPIEKAIDIILKGSSVKIDLGSMNGHYFAAAAGCGPLSDALITPHRRDKENWKMLAYAGSMMQTLAEPPMHFNVTADGENFHVTASGIFITNIADLGVGMLSETASMHDGLLDLCILAPKEFTDFVHYGFHFAAGSATSLTGGKAPYYLKKVREVEIDLVKKRRPLSFLQREFNALKYTLSGKRPKAIHSGKAQAMIDGDACGQLPMTVKVIPDAVRIICPLGN
ncbi:MAG: NAD(+)/NADH kinase [Cyanobacteria bacterium SZAS TMP-1]|nr:NAD(+)/NADH kinase [Cyanobacteria bacterium SZAS TMP-1]